MEQSFAALQEYFSPSRQHENASNLAQLVLFAEHALKNGYPSVASECIQLYFSLDPPANQFLIRAHLCEALVAAPSTSSTEESWVNLQEALGYIVTAVNIARKSECYHFLVYNASVQLWHMCRPFQRPGHYRLFVKALQTVVRALEECKEKDHAWRLELMMGLVHSQLDAGQREEAAKTCVAAAELARRRVPNKMVNILKFQVYHHLGDGKVFEKEKKSSPELAAIARLYTVKCAIQQQSTSGPELEQKLRKVFTFITKGEEGSSGRRTGSVTSMSPPAVEVWPSLLLELGGVCVEHHFTKLALECMDALPGREDVGDPRLGLQKEFIHCQLMVQQLGPVEEESYARSTVEVRLLAVGRMEEAVTSALRLGDPELIQHASVVQWNLCLPLLHPNLRQHLSKPLTAVTSALEHVNSLLHPLRCAVHLELAKVCADRNQLEAAMEHLSKALLLDPHGKCSGRVRVLQHRLLLRAQLYDTPEDPVDRAAKIVEQAGSTADKSTLPEDLRSVLVNAGELLAPDCFTHTLGSSQGSAPSNGALSHEHVLLLNLQEKGKKLRDLELVKHQVKEHAKAVEQSRDKERCRLWADLTKTARKQGIWDVASAAGRFCILYDDGRWTVQHKSSSKSVTKRTSSPRINRHASSLTRVESHHRSATRSRSPLSPFATGMEKPASHDEEDDRRELLRMLAEIHCLLAECLVYQLQQEGVGLGEQPAPPTITEHDHWRMYCDWASQLSADARSSFLRAAELGCSLGESWLVCNAATYLWNYSHQWIEQDKPSELVGTFRPLLASIKEARLQNEALLVCRVSTVVAKGLVQRWIPRPNTSIGEGGGVGGGGERKAGKPESRGGATTAKKGKGGGGGEQLQVDPEAGPELKEALEVCEYGMAVSAGAPVAIRGGLLAVWVQCKQLLQQFIPAKTFGVEEQAADPHTHHCRAIVAIEIISRMGNGIWDFPCCPTLEEALSLLEECVWDDGMVGVELYIRIASLALKQKEYMMVCQCAEKVLQKQEGKSQNGVKQKKTKGEGEPDLSQRIEWELLCLASFLLGQSLVASAAGNMATTRRALEAFLDSARYGHRGRSYPRVMEACGHYWNTCLPLTGSALNRELLQHPLSELLGLVVSLMGGRGWKKKSEGKPRVTSDPTTPTSTSEEDMRLLVTMYGLVFQAYADQQQWKEGLKAIEDAMWATPRATHRHLAQHKLVFKSRMGRSVEGDMLRFQEEPEDFIATLWYKAATNSSNPAEQLKAYQNAIQTLQSPSHGWQKVEYLLEFSEWLYCHQFPVQDALDQLQVAADILSTTGAEGDKSLASHPPDPPSPPLDSPSPPPDPPSPPLDSPSPPAPPTSVRHLEALVRVYVMMEELCGRGAAQHQALCLAALGYCYCIWKQTLHSYGEAKSGGGGCQLPTEVVGWATFALTDEVKDFIKTGSEMEQLSRTTVQTPMLLIHYLGILARELCACDLQPLVLPVLSLQLATAECLITEGSKPLCQLIHMRIASVCTSLGLHSAAATHSDEGTAALNPEDLAVSHADMEHHMAKRQAVEKEEAKRSTDHVMARSQAKGSTEQPHRKYAAGLYCLSDRVQLREVWVQQASLLIQQGQYQASRELLHEARLSSQTLGDVHTLVRALLGLATLALAEGNIHKAASFLAEAQQLPSHWDSWLAGVLLLSEITCHEEEGEGSSHGQTRTMVEWALHLLEAVGERNKSEVPKVQHAEALLKSRLAVHSIQKLLGSAPAPQATNQVMKNCDVLLQCSKTLLQLGHNREAAQVMAQQASILRRVGLASDNSELHQENLLQALSLYQKAAEILQCAYENSRSLCQPSEEVSLPVQRELVSTQLCMVDLLVLVFAEHTHEKREARNLLQQKSSIEQMIDEFVRETPVLSPTGQEWKYIASSAMERALGILSSAHSLASNDSVLKAKCVYSIGRCLHLLSKCASPDPELQWRVWEGEEGKGEEGRLGGGVHHSTLSTVMRKEEATQAEVEESSSLGYLAQAVHSMIQAVTLALQDQEWDLAMKASLEIVDCCGSFDPMTTSQYLALYQSCAVAQELCSLLREAQSDPSSSQLAALLLQHSTLKQSAGSVFVPALSAIKEQMETFESWRRLRVVENHLDLLRHFPCHFRFVVLQHSPDRSQLYAAYLIPPQPPPPAPKKGQPPPQIESLEPVVVCVSTSPGAVNSLLELAADFQHHVTQMLAKPSHLNKQHESEHLDGLNSQFADIQAAMEAYLSTATNPIADALSNQARKWHSEKLLTMYPLPGYCLVLEIEWRRESSDKELTVVLLADSSLLQLPLEALSFLHTGNIYSVTRDFSLQMFYHRIAKYAPENSVDSSKDKKRGSYQAQPATLLADAGNIEYVLDPRDDMICDGGEDPCGKIIGQIQAHAKLTSKWGRHVGTNHPISDGEWPPLLQSCSGLLFFGSERFLAHLPPARLTSLSLQDCSVVILMDRMHTSRSALIQSKLDLHKSAMKLRLENSLQTVMLLSLVGANCVVGNQWHTMVHMNLDKMNTMIKGLLSESNTVGSLNWTHTKCAFSKAQVRDGDAHEADIQGSTGKNGDTNTREATPVDQWSLYNCVLYGLPHLTLVAQATA